MGYFRAVNPALLFFIFSEVVPINYKLLSQPTDLVHFDTKELIAHNRNLPLDWCTRKFTKRPSFNFKGTERALNVILQHLKFAEFGIKEKFQIVVDSDLDGIVSAAILYKFLNEFYDYHNFETVFSLHSGKQHGLSKDIKIDNDTTLVLCPDSASNDAEQAKALHDKNIDVICLDHHIIEQDNPYAAIVNCMDGEYPNTELCGAAVTWLFLYSFAFECVQPCDDMRAFLLNMLDLVAVATISDIMPVTNEDNMYFIQNGLSNIHSSILKSFLWSQEIPLDDVTIEHIKFKVAPMISAMIRMGSMEEKTLLFKGFVDDYEEFDYEKRGSFDVLTENIYDRVVRLCKNAKGRQDRAKQKLLDECQVHEYEHILLVEYQGSKPSTLTGLVANELANQYCKPCIVYHQSSSYLSQDGGGLEYSGSIRNYDGSPISSFKDVLECAFGDECMVQGHDNAAGFFFFDLSPDEFAERFSKTIRKNINFADDFQNAAIGEKIYNVDFELDADDVDAGLVRSMVYFDHYTGYGFDPVTVLVHDINVNSGSFRTMGKNSLSWKINGDGVDYVKFKITRDDPLLREMDDIDFDSEEDYGKLYDVLGKLVSVDAICTFGLNVYNGVIYPQLIVKDYELKINDVETISEDNFDLDLDLGI